MAITTYTDFVNNYLTKNGMIGNAANINKAPDQLKLEIDEVNLSITNANISRADKFLAAQNIANMIYNTSGDLIKIRYTNNTDVNYEVLAYNTNGDLITIQHYVESILNGTTTLSYTAGELTSVVYIAA
jgi:hypothetical protein